MNPPSNPTIHPTLSPRGRTRRKRSLVALVSAGLVAVLLLGGCEVNQPAGGLSAQDKLQPANVPTSPANVVNVSYGPDPMHKLDVYRPAGVMKGTVVYFHSGGWIAGTKSEVVPFIRSLTNEGYAVVSVDYRLAPAVRYREILSDADRALRYVRANANTLGVNVSTFIVAGSSAGGYIASMMGAAPGKYADAALPANLKNVSPKVDGVISQVGPTNLEELWKAGDFGIMISDALLGCAAGPYPSAYQPCAPNEAKFASPWFYASLTAWYKGTLPPMYGAYGTRDTLVQPATQGRPLMDAWEQAAGFNRAYYDNPPTGDHNIDYTLNRTVFKVWLDKVQTRSW